MRFVKLYLDMFALIFMLIQMIDLLFFPDSIKLADRVFDSAIMLLFAIQYYIDNFRHRKITIRSIKELDQFIEELKNKHE